MEDDLQVINVTFFVLDRETTETFFVSAHPDRDGDAWQYSVKPGHDEGTERMHTFEPTQQAPRLMIALEYVTRYVGGDF